MSAPPPPYSSGIVIPIQAELGELGDELVQEPRLAIELLLGRRDSLLREVADRLADELVLFTQVGLREASRELDGRPDAPAGAAAL